MEQYVFTKTITGTGAAINVDCGFVPAYIKVINVTDKISLEYWDTMAADAGLKIAPVATSPTASEMTVVSSNGITLTGSSDNFQGFKLGTDSVNGSGDTLHIVAFRN